jgi:hypothetical protein
MIRLSSDEEIVLEEIDITSMNQKETVRGKVERIKSVRLSHPLGFVVSWETSSFCMFQGELSIGIPLLGERKKFEFQR